MSHAWEIMMAVILKRRKLQVDPFLAEEQAGLKRPKHGSTNSYPEACCCCCSSDVV